MEKKKINYTEISDEEITNLYRKLQEKRQKIYKRIMNYNEKYHFLNINDSKN